MLDGPVDDETSIGTSGGTVSMTIAPHGQEAFSRHQKEQYLARQFRFLSKRSKGAPDFAPSDNLKVDGHYQFESTAAQHRYGCTVQSGNAARRWLLTKPGHRELLGSEVFVESSGVKLIRLDINDAQQFDSGPR